jgi:probable HAF family extracellular repeat protein
LPYDLNNADQVVGTGNYRGGLTFGFLWQNGNLFNLNDLIVQGDIPVFILHARDITDEGRIIGYGIVPGAGSNEAIKLTPLHPRAGDVDCDLDVDVDDLLGVINTWGACDVKQCHADLNEDFIVNLLDLMIVISDWDE